MPFSSPLFWRVPLFVCVRSVGPSYGKAVMGCPSAACRRAAFVPWLNPRETWWLNTPSPGLSCLFLEENAACGGPSLQEG